MALTGKFAFMDAVDVKLYPAGTDVSSGAPAVDPEGTIVIDYLNESQLTLEMDTQYARIKGNNAVPFNGARTGSFTMGAECISMEYLAMVMGGSYDSTTDAITVTGDAPSRGFVLVGTFKGKKHGTNALQTFQVILYNVAVQPAVDLTLNATDIGSFTLTLDVLSDTNNRIAQVTPKN
jgi:hypothetical protein